LKPPRKALILAAGFGTRLLPLTRVVPKPLLPLGGIPMLDRALAMVKSWGVRDVVINLHHGADKLLRHILDRTTDGLTINLSFEPDILGTGGALVKAAWFFKDHEPFWIVNADVAADVDGRKIARAFRPGKTIAAAWLVGDRGPRTVECSRGYITNFATKHPDAPGTFTFSGVHLVDPRILNYLPADGFASIVPAYERAMKDGWRVAGVEVNNSLWADIGTPAQYVDAARQVGRGTCPAVASSRRRIRPSRDSARIVNGLIIAPGIPNRNYAGIMAVPATALEPAELALAQKWSRKPGMIACPLAPRGSSRNFVRLYSGRKTAMLVTHDPAREENNLYASHARFLGKLGLPVPRVLAENVREHVALFEDVGEKSVQDLVPEKSAAWLEKIYEDVIDQLIVFHEQGYRAAKNQRITLMPPFNEKLYEWEHNLFTELFLRDLSGLGEVEIKEIKRELRNASRSLSKARLVLVHRDLQSSNILLRGNRWSLIDFQGMRFGPAVYDLASLLLDPYIRIDGAMRLRLLARYEAQAGPESRVSELFWLAGIQRLGQALGAYARLGKNPGTARFLKYIPPALENLAEALRYAGGCTHLAALNR
jgi:aminoglycoside/choline kinase family phosphotransferase/dTDP-glucose pyrophosphorylase